MSLRPDNDRFKARDADAVMTFGQLCGALSYCSEATLRVFAGQALRHALISALRQEGHAFTDMRFHAWFAGLTTLSDESPRHARDPRSVCSAILTELANWDDAIVSQLAEQLKTALLAPLDSSGHNANAEAHRIVEAARMLVRGLPSADSPAPLSDLAALHDALASSIDFAPSERTTTRLAFANRQFDVALPAPQAPLWAIDMLAGRHLCDGQGLRIAFPMPGLARLEAFGMTDGLRRRQSGAPGLLEAAGKMLSQLRSAHALASFVHAPVPGRRGSSRAPMLMELLAGFGPLRSRQIETMLGASRLGVTGMIESWEAQGAIGRTTISGSHLLELRATPRDLQRPTAPEPSAFSAGALDDYEASLEAIDRLLARRNNLPPVDDED